MNVQSGVYMMPCRFDFSEIFARVTQRCRENRLRARKNWVEFWFADQMGMTVQQWRVAQMRVRGLTLEEVTP